MIRLRILSGITSIEEMYKIYQLAEKHKVEKINFTTRQEIQLHGLGIDEICSEMKKVLHNNIYNKDSGVNYPRNIVISPLSGVDNEEAFDVSEDALAVGNYFLERIHKYKLPRKLKLAFSSSKSDSAHCKIQDLGFVAVNKGGIEYFEIYLGGGLGQNIKTSVRYKELIKREEIFYYVEAMVRMFIEEGNYQTKGRARLRYILERMGEESFLECYKKYVEKIKVSENLIRKVRSKVYDKEGIEVKFSDSRVLEQKQKGLYSVYLHFVGGQLYIKDLKTILDKIKNYYDIEIRLSVTGGIYLRNLNGNEAKVVLKLTENMGAKTKVEQSISCVGAPLCQRGICNSQGLLKEIIECFNSLEYKLDTLPKIHISGCANSCGAHQTAYIGFAGKKRRANENVEEYFTLFAGGEFTVNETKFGISYGNMLRDNIPRFLYELATKIEETKLNFDGYLKMNEENFKEIVKKYSL